MARLRNAEGGARAGREREREMPQHGQNGKVKGDALPKQHQTPNQHQTEKERKKLKLVLLGEIGVGKASLVNRYVDNKFAGANHKCEKRPLCKVVQLDGKSVTLEIFYPKAQEINDGLAVSFYNNINGCLLVYDVNNPNALVGLENWLNQFKTRVTPTHECPVLVVGNKVDTGNVVGALASVSSWCHSKNLRQISTSAKDNKNVSHAFEEIARAALQQSRNPKPSPAAPALAPAPAPAPKPNPPTPISPPTTKPPRSSFCCTIL